MRTIGRLGPGLAEQRWPRRGNEAGRSGSKAARRGARAECRRGAACGLFVRSAPGFRPAIRPPAGPRSQRAHGDSRIPGAVQGGRSLEMSRATASVRRWARRRAAATVTQRPTCAGAGERPRSTRARAARMRPARLTSVETTGCMADVLLLAVATRRSLRHYQGGRTDLRFDLPHKSFPQYFTLIDQ